MCVQVIGVYQRKFKFQDDPMQVEPASDDQALSDWTMSLIKTMRADMDSDKLYPPGNVYLMVSLAASISLQWTDEPVGIL